MLFFCFNVIRIFLNNRCEVYIFKQLVHMLSHNDNTVTVNNNVMGVNHNTRCCWSLKNCTVNQKTITVSRLIKKILGLFHKFFFSFHLPETIINKLVFSYICNNTGFGFNKFHAKAIVVFNQFIVCCIDFIIGVHFWKNLHNTLIPDLTVQIEILIIEIHL